MEDEQEELTRNIGKLERQATNISDQVKIEAQVYLAIREEKRTFVTQLSHIVSIFFFFVGIVTFVWYSIRGSSYGSGSAVRVLGAN